MLVMRPWSVASPLIPRAFYGLTEYRKGRLPCRAAMASITKWASPDGEFRRQESSFRDFIGEGSRHFRPEAGRYILYVSLACPWAHRTLAVRALKSLENVIDVVVVDPVMGEQGWSFSDSEKFEGCNPDPLYGAQYLRDIYYKANPDYRGRFTVPCLFDQLKETIVNNESSEIIRMMNSAFDGLDDVNKKVDLYPESLREEIDKTNTWVYEMVNNGVYKSGFATTQKAYESHVYRIFEGLDRCEDILKNHRFLVSDTFTEADVRLWTSVIRFDPVYHGHFKCNMKSISKDYPEILNWARRIYQMPGVKETVDLNHIKTHYYRSHTQINPTGVIPVGNGPDLSVPAQ